MKAATPRTVGNPSSKSESESGWSSPGMSIESTVGSFAPQRQTSIFGGTRRPHDGHERLADGFGEIGDGRVATLVPGASASATPARFVPQRHTSILLGTRRPQDGHTRLDAAESSSGIQA